MSDNQKPKRVGTNKRKAFKSQMQGDKPTANDSDD